MLFVFSEFYNIWDRNKSIPDKFMVMDYENIHLDPKKELKRLLSFIGLDQINDELISKAVEYSAFENMRKIESKSLGSTRMLKPADPNDPESYKTRKGKVGGYKDYLNNDEINIINAKIQNALSPTFSRYK